jgi:hypothetical protein
MNMESYRAGWLVSNIFDSLADGQYTALTKCPLVALLGPHANVHSSTAAKR